MFFFIVLAQELADAGLQVSIKPTVIISGGQKTVGLGIFLGR